MVLEQGPSLVHVSTQPLKAAVRRRKSPLDTTRQRAQFAGCRLKIERKKKVTFTNMYLINKFSSMFPLSP